MKVQNNVTVKDQDGNSSKPLLSTGILTNLMFHDNGKCNFKHFENMHYWVKKGICLFYNYPIQEGEESSFYIGYFKTLNSFINICQFFNS